MWGPLLAATLAIAGSSAPTVTACADQWGPPSRDPALVERTRTAGEPLLLYWMQTRAAPLGVGPALPGTLVANFDVHDRPDDAVLRDLTFLALADDDARADLERALRDAGAVTDEARVEREGGQFRELSVALPDGRTGTVALRETSTGQGMADGRPSPTVWMHLADARPAAE